MRLGDGKCDAPATTPAAVWPLVHEWGKASGKVDRFGHCTSILQATAIRPAGWMTEGLSRHRLCQGGRHAIDRAPNIGFGGRGTIVDRTVLDQGPFWVNDKHMRCGLGSIRPTDFACRIEDRRRRGRPCVVHIGFLTAPIDLALLVHCQRNDRQPDAPFRRRLCLKLLHVP